MYLKGNTRLHKSSNIVKSLKLRYLYQIKWFNCNNSTKSASRSLTDFKPLGEGSYAAVFSALDSELNLKVAVKVFDKRQVIDRFKRNLIQKELDLMVKIDHKNIVQLYKVLEDRIKIFFVMEFCGEKNLKKQVILKNVHTDEESNTNLLNKSDVIKIMKTLINTVAYLHKNQIFHRDIKLANIMYYNNEAKLIDFGLAIHNPSLPLYSLCGTLPYMAPEMIKRQNHNPGPLDI